MEQESLINLKPFSLATFISGPLVMLFAPLYHMAWSSLLFAFSLQRAEKENCFSMEKSNNLLVPFIP
jgi:hypothetical protein